ncbi:hypothetical protein [Cognatishimia sp. MH4019]|uniref:hypothetical protein n=1 Tax=Cognatishimia sp. MH4019 TaxID=2854030 RepID=UPI001CD769D9|nr:hypothetical protein [Cognatishimia sp. MH4019]
MTDAPITLQRGRGALLSGRGSLTVALAGIGLLLLLAALFGRIMDFGIRRDEMLFVAPAVLLESQSLYADFFYNHVPYSAWLFRASALVFGDIGVLFSARLAVFGAWLLLLGTSYWSVARLSGSPLLGLVAVVALITSETLLGQAGMAASNNLLPLAFSILAVALFVTEVVDERTRFAPLCVAGLSLSIAIGMKVSAVAIMPPLLVASLLLPREMTFGARLKNVLFPALIGALIGAVPLFIVLMQAPELFMAHVVGFHTGPHVAYWDAFRHTEPNLAMGVQGKVLLAYGGWLSGSVLLMALLTLAAGWAAVLRPAMRLPVGAAMTVLAILAASMIMSFVPTPGFPQYYAAPIVFVPLLTALLVRPLARAEVAFLTPIFAASIMLMLVLAMPRLAPGLATLASPERTQVAQIAKGGAGIAAALDKAGVEGPVATFLPLYPLEAGLDVYPELATGQFAYRIDAFLTPELAAQYVVAGPDAMIARFAQTPPAAFLLGYEPALEGPFQDWAIANGYKQVDVAGLSNRYGEGVLLVRDTGGAAHDE